jgi:S1-C subfamily serine protease
MKNNYWLFIVLGGTALVVALVFAAAFGAGITYFFLQAEPVQAALTSPVDIANDEGVLVSGVKPESSAAEAGLVRGDIILEINGEPVNNMVEMKAILLEQEPGDIVDLTVLHGDDIKTLSVELDDAKGFATLSVGMCDFSKDIRMFPGGPKGEVFIEELFLGAEILDVVPESPAAVAGLQVGDVIFSVNGKPIGPKADLADLIQKYAPGDEVTLKIQSDSDEESREVSVTLGGNPGDPEKAYLGVTYQLGAPMSFKGGEFPFMDEFPFEELPEEWEDGMPKFFFHHGEEFDGQLPEGWEDLMPHFFDMPDLPEGVEGAVIIKEVMEETPAAEVSLQPGDLIIAVDGEPVEEIEAFVDTLQSHRPGDEITLTIIRENEEIQAQVTLTAHPDNPDKGYLGVLVGSLVIMKEMELPEGFEKDFELELPGVPGGDA